MLIECPLDVPFGMPSPEALQLATAVIRRLYVVPETMQHPRVRSECIRLAYLIQAYGLASTNSAPQQDINDIKSCRPQVSVQPSLSHCPEGSETVNERCGIV